MFSLTLHESVSLYKDIFTNTLDPSVIFDGRGNINYVNKVLLKFSSFSSEELTGKPVTILVAEKEKSRIKNIIEEVLKEKQIFRNFNTFFLTKNGKEIPTALTAFPLLEKKKLVGGLAVFVDIRQLQGLLSSLGKAKSELEQRVKERTGELENKTSELEKAKKELERAKNILEVKVKDRTKKLQELNITLEDKVERRTKELQEKLDELNKWYKLTVGRELKMLELKGEIKKLKKR